MEQIDRFMEVYSVKLTEAVREFPEEYCYTVEAVPLVCARMRNALLRGSYHLIGPALRRTCKELGIKFTYKAVREFLRGNPSNSPAVGV